MLQKIQNEELDITLKKDGNEYSYSDFFNYIDKLFANKEWNHSSSIKWQVSTVDSIRLAEKYKTTSIL